MGISSGKSWFSAKSRTSFTNLLRERLRCTCSADDAPFIITYEVDNVFTKFWWERVKDGCPADDAPIKW